MKEPSKLKSECQSLEKIVGIGASAGGLEAFTELLGRLPKRSGAAYVLVQHLDPTHRSLLSELLAKTTTLSVCEIVDRTSVQPNQIYVIPPNCDLAIENAILKLSPRKKNGGPARSIDHFLKSLATDQKERAIGVILSGAGSDGALGLKTIKAAGGITFAQDEDTAKYDSMPRSAIGTGCVDFVLPPQKIADEIARLIRTPERTKRRAAANAQRRRNAVADTAMALNGQAISPEDWPTSPDDPNLRKIFFLLQAKTGADFRFYKANTIRRRLNRRLVMHKVQDLGEYAKYLREHPLEVDALYQDLLINVTSFFRNPAVYDLLKRNVFPRLMKSSASRDGFRFWIPGCSTGQEPYSIAMAYSEFAAQRSGQVPPLQIFATDVNPSVLEYARAGRYPTAQVEISEARLRRFFVEEDGYHRVQKTIRDQVIFAQQNVLTDPPFTRVDLISCRNMLIYLEPQLQQKIIPTFHYALKPNGVLLLGSSESIGQFSNLFNTLEKTHKIYIKKPGSTTIRLQSALPPVVTKKIEPPPSFIKPGEFNISDAQKEADRWMLAKYGPASVLINEEGDILQFRGQATKYLSLPMGKATYRIFKMAREGLVVPLQHAVQKAIKERRIAREKDVKFEGRKARVNIEVIPLKNTKGRCLLVLFEKSHIKRPATIGAGVREVPVHTRAALRHLAEAKHELVETREHLHSLQEEYETSVEELQASNEEVQSSNEELQSLNEELETSNEELESANEELTTLNEELATRNTELRESERRLREQAQLLELAPVLARSTRDRIIFWNLGAEKLYGFTKEEAIGQTSHLLLGAQLPEPLEKIQAKLHKTGHWDGEIWHRKKDGTVICVASQWVVHHDDQNKVRAILEVNTDITARKTAEKALRESDEFNRKILESSPDCISLLDIDGRLTFMTPVGMKLMEMREFSKYANLYWPNLWDKESRKQAENAITKATVGQPARFQGSCPTAEGNARWWDVVLQSIIGQDRKPEKLLAVARDITEEKEQESAHLERMRLTSLRADVASTLAQANELAAVLQAVGEKLSASLDGALVQLWILDSHEAIDLQVCAGPLAGKPVEARVKVRQREMVQIALSRQPLLVPDFSRADAVCDSDWAAREGFVAFAAYPMIVNDHVTGVLATFARSPLADPVRKELSFTASAIAQFIHRKQAEENLRHAQEELSRYTVDLERLASERTVALRDSNQQMESFLYSVSHDLRAPLRSMQGLAACLIDEYGSKLDAGARDWLNRISESAIRMDVLTQDLLTFSRFSQAELKFESVSVLGAVDYAIKHLEADITEKKASFKITSTLPNVIAHVASLQQVIINLISNGIKFSRPDEAPQIKIWAEERDAFARIHVQDNGIGIAPEYHQRIFKMFERLHVAREYPGTGIGLAIVQRSVERMSGRCGVESALKKGSCFWFELPLAPEQS